MGTKNCKESPNGDPQQCPLERIFKYLREYFSGKVECLPSSLAISKQYPLERRLAPLSAFPMGKDQLHKSFSRKGIFKSWVVWGILASLFERAIKMEENPFSEVVKFELMSQIEIYMGSKNPFTFFSCQ